MQRGNRTNLGLALLVALLALLLWLDPAGDPRSGQLPLTRLQADDVTRIRLDNAQITGLLLQRQGDQWRMLAPADLPADRQTVRQLLGILQAPVIEMFPLPAELQPFGLDPPQARLTLNDIRLEIGTTEPLNHLRYVRIGQQIHLIKDIYPHLLLAAADRYIAKPLEP